MDLARLFITLGVWATIANAYWLMGANNILTTQRIDPILTPDTVSTHVHSILGGSNFGLNISTARLRESQCTSIPIPQDKSNYWYPHLYWQHRNGTFTSVEGNAVIYYLFSDTPNATTAFPEDFRMISGNPRLRTLDPTSFAQQAITYICLDFEGKSSKFNELPEDVRCPSGIRAQINFPSCWDGQNVDSENHQSHVSFLSTGPDNGTCSDPGYPVTLPRIFLEVYWQTYAFENQREEAMCPKQPFVYASGDPTGYGFHADFYNGWDAGVLERALRECNCNPFGDPACCVQKGIFDMQSTNRCYISNTFDEQVLGNLSVLPGPNPVQRASDSFIEYSDSGVPAVLSPVIVYTSIPNADNPAPTGTIAAPARSGSISPEPTIVDADDAEFDGTEGKCVLRLKNGDSTLGPPYHWSAVFLVLCLFKFL